MPDPASLSRQNGIAVGDDALKRHAEFDLEAAMADAHNAAAAAFRKHGMRTAKVVVNVHWTDGRGGSYVAGSRVPNRTPKWLAESLRLTAEEVEDQ